MAENFLDRIVSGIGDWIGLKSLQDQLDENFDNGIEVAAAPLAPNGFVLGNGRKYVKKIGNSRVYDSSPRDIIRNHYGQYPIKSIVRNSTEEPYILKNTKTGEVFTSLEPISSDNFDFAYKKNGELRKNWVSLDTRTDLRKNFEDTYNNVRELRERDAVLLKDDPLTERMYRIDNGMSSGIKDDINKYGKATSAIQSAFTPQDWKDYVESKRKSKEQGEYLAREFSRSGNNTTEKRKYLELSGGAPELWGIQYPYHDRPTINKFSSKGDAQKYLDENKRRGLVPNYGEGEPVLVQRGHKATKALGGQNAKYLNGHLHEYEVHGIDELEDSARPISYDENGNPYVRGYTWTQTGNIPKILDPNSGYLSIVGSDAAVYHPDIVGQWTSYGWGNPMDKNYDNNVAPGEVERQYKYVVTGPDGKKNEYNDFWDADAYVSRQVSNGANRSDFKNEKIQVGEKNFDEHLIETRWPLKFYQKSNSVHQPNQEKVVVMGSKPGSKDVHIPFMGGKQYFDNTDKALDAYYSAGLIKKEDYDYMKSIRNSLGLKGTGKILNRLRELGLGNFNKPTGTNVYKIATPSSMMRTFNEENMPWDWSMWNREVGGKTLPGFHPNKEWPNISLEDFINVGKKANEMAYHKAVRDANKLGYKGSKLDSYVAMQLSKDPAVKSAIISNGLSKDGWSGLNKLQMNAVGDLLSSNDYKSPYDLSASISNGAKNAPKQGVGSVARGTFFNPSDFSEFQRNAMLNAAWDKWNTRQLINEPNKLEYHTVIPNRFDGLIKSKGYSDSEKKDGKFKSEFVLGGRGYEDYFKNNGVDVDLLKKLWYKDKNLIYVPEEKDPLSLKKYSSFCKREMDDIKPYHNLKSWDRHHKESEEDYKSRAKGIISGILNPGESLKKRFGEVVGNPNMTEEEYRKSLVDAWKRRLEFKKFKKELGNHLGKTLFPKMKKRKDDAKIYEYKRLVRERPELADYINSYENPVENIYKIRGDIFNMDNMMKYHEGYCIGMNGPSMSDGHFYSRLSSRGLR